MLPTTDCLLLGPGPSPVSPQVLAAPGAAPRSHPGRDVGGVLDDVRDRLSRVFGAPGGALTFAVSGTGTAGMETVVANLAEPGRRALVIVNGYFGDRLASMFARYGAEVVRLDVEWGHAVDPSEVETTLAGARFDLVGVVHGETSTGVCNPVQEITRLAPAQRAP